MRLTNPSICYAAFVKLAVRRDRRFARLPYS